MGSSFLLSAVPWASNGTGSIERCIGLAHELGGHVMTAEEAGFICNIKSPNYANYGDSALNIPARLRAQSPQLRNHARDA